MAIAFRSVSYANNGVIARPTGVVAGDLLLLSWHVDANILPNPPGGFTQIRNAAVAGAPGSGQGGALITYYKIATGAEPTTYSLGSVGQSANTPVLLAYSGTHPTDPVAGSTGGAGYATEVFATPSIVTQRYDSTIVLIGARSIGTALFPQVGIERAYEPGTQSNSAQRIFDYAQSTPGPSPVPSWFTNSTVSYAYMTQQVELRVANRLPDAPLRLSPAANEALNKDNTNRASWQHSDPDSDSQVTAQVRWRVGAGPWNVATVTGPNQFYDWPPGTFSLAEYEWQVRTADGAGYGPWSSPGYFTAASLPTGPAITAPVNGETVGQVSVSLAWSVTDQDAYRVRSVADLNGAPDPSTVYYDSGELVGATTRSAAIALPVNSRYEHLQVQVKDNGLFSPWSSVRILVSYTTPAVALLSVLPVQTVASTYSFTDANAVTIVNPAPTGGQPQVSYRNVWCKATNAGDPYRPAGVPVRIATFVPSGVFTDRAVASGVDYEYAVEQVAVNGTASMTDYTDVAVDLPGADDPFEPTFTPTF